MQMIFIRNSKFEIRTLLLPLAWLYRVALLLRRQYFRLFRPPRKLGRPTLKVGNITAGGTGKTPFVIYLAKLLKKRKLQPVVLLRGYGRHTSGVLKVSSNLPFTSVGDEPKLILDQAHCPVYVCEDRFAGAQEALSEHPHATFILDDAYQQLGIQADINFLLVDATNPFDQGLLLPAGRMREPLHEINRADAIIVTRADHPFDQDWLMSTLKKYNHGASIFFAYNEVIGLQELPCGRWLPTEKFRGKNVVMMCAIGNPNIFEFDISHHQMLIRHRILLPDHHSYTQADIDRCLRGAATHGADIVVTTEKDAIKFEGLSIPPGKIYSLGIEAKVDEEENFLEYLKMFLDI
ncbi:MAG TPA: tetraacyldisaccharide 4'-kinase [Acidobacteriota bacterium]|jgi:tetraacyldisaccharide 4'-kinase|nr:tetraacyldisaccharide 4'-kinase [Acidobacteriota bacterium]